MSVRHDRRARVTSADLLDHTPLGSVTDGADIGLAALLAARPDPPEMSGERRRVRFRFCTEPPANDHASAGGSFGASGGLHLASRVVRIEDILAGHRGIELRVSLGCVLQSDDGGIDGVTDVHRVYAAVHLEPGRRVRWCGRGPCAGRTRRCWW